MKNLLPAAVAAAAVLYYRIPLKRRWVMLLAAGILCCCFFLVETGEEGQTVSWLPVILFFLSCAVSWAGGLLMEALRERGTGKGTRTVLLFLLSVLCAGPVLYDRLGGLLFTSILHDSSFQSLPGLRSAVTGLSAVPLLLAAPQGISYMADAGSGQVRAQRNPLKYLAYACFFPVMAAGPLQRYWELKKGLFEGNRFDRARVTGGLQLILWGLFLRLVIADRAAIGAETVYGHTGSYMGLYFLLAGGLFALQVYTRLLASVSIAAGVGGVFGFSLFTGFRQPLQAASTAEYWERFNGTVTGWLYDYIYRPLSGIGVAADSRATSLPRWCLGLYTAALMGGFWYADGFRAVLLGILAATFILCGKLTEPAREEICRVLRLPAGTYARRLVGRAGTFVWTFILWLLLGAPSLRKGLAMLLSILRDFNPWIFFDGGLLQMGLSWGDWNVLIAAFVLLLYVEREQRRFCIRSWVRDQHALVRWGLCGGLLLAVFLFGIYGGAA